MRKLLIVIVVLAFCSVPTWADSVVFDVNAWATFTGTQPCTSNCTETIGVSFLYTPPPSTNITPGNFLGTVVPGSMEVSSSGFLGAFSSEGGVTSQGYTGFTNFLGDEIDLLGFSTTGIQSGINTLDFELFFCRSEACDSAYGPDVTHPNPTIESSVVTRVAVPDGTSFLWLCLSAFASIGLVWRWRRRPEQIPVR